MWYTVHQLSIRVCTRLAALLTFTSQVTAEFNHINGLDLVCRAHQLVQEGLKYMFTGSWLFVLALVVLPLCHCCFMQSSMSSC